MTYDPSLEVPTEIKEAATRITIWMTQNGWKDWELMGVADRNLVTKLREQLAAAVEALERIGLGHQMPRPDHAARNALAALAKIGEGKC